MNKSGCLALIMTVVVLAVPSAALCSEVEKSATGNAGRLQWLWADLGTAIGQGLMEAVDFEGDGRLELVTSGGGRGFGDPTAIFILEDDLVRARCVMPHTEKILDYHIAQLDSDPQLELLIANRDALVVMDGASCEMEARLPFPDRIDAAGLGDVDADGRPDVVYSQDGDLFLSPWDDLADKTSRIGFGGRKIIVEPLDDLEGDEIAVSGPALYVLNGTSLQTITEIDVAERSMILFGDLDGDGTGEVIVADYGYGVSAYSVPSGELVFNFLPYNPGVIRVFDIDSDGDQEVVCGGAQGGGVDILDGDGTPLGSLNSPSGGVSNVVVADLEGNGSLEFFWGAGINSSDSDHLYRARFGDESYSWRSLDLGGAYRIAGPADHMADGRRSVIFSFRESNSGYDSGGYLVLDAKEGSILDRVIPETDFSRSGRVNAIAAANLDDDSAYEVCLGYSEGVECLSFGAVFNQWSRLTSDEVEQLTVKDIDADGENELLAVTRNSSVRAYAASNGFLEWVSPRLFDNDGCCPEIESITHFNGELWVLSLGKDIRLVNSATGLTSRSIEDTGLTHLGSDGPRLYGIRDSEGLGVLDPVTLEFEQLLYATEEPLTELVISKDGSMILVAFDIEDPAKGVVVSRTLVVVSTKQAFESRVVVQTLFEEAHFTDWQELYLATPYGIAKYDLSSLVVIHQSGFEAAEQAPD